MLHSKIRAPNSSNSNSGGSDDEGRPKSGESRKSNNSNGSGSSREESSSLPEDHQFREYIVLEYAENGDLFDFTVAF